MSFAAPAATHCCCSIGHDTLTESLDWTEELLIGLFRFQHLVAPRSFWWPRTRVTEDTSRTQSPSSYECVHGGLQQDRRQKAYAPVGGRIQTDTHATVSFGLCRWPCKSGERRRFLDSPPQWRRLVLLLLQLSFSLWREGLLFFRFHWVSDALEEVNGGRATGGWTGDVVVVIDSSQGFQAAGNSLWISLDPPNGLATDWPPLSHFLRTSGWMDCRGRGSGK